MKNFTLATIAVSGLVLVSGAIMMAAGNLVASGFNLEPLVNAGNYILSGAAAVLSVATLIQNRGQRAQKIAVRKEELQIDKSRKSTVDENR